MHAVMPVDIIDTDQAHVRFMDQGGRLHGVAGRRIVPVEAGQMAQFVINERDQLRLRRFISSNPRLEQTSDIRSHREKWGAENSGAKGTWGRPPCSLAPHFSSKSVFPVVF